MSKAMTALLGYGVALALAVAAIATSVAVPRERTDSLYGLFVTVTIVIVVIVATTTISILFRGRSVGFLLALGSISAIIAFFAQIFNSNVADSPDVFSSSILTPVGAAIALACLLISCLRLLRRKGATTRMPGA